MVAIAPKKGDVVSFQFVRNGLIGDGKTQVKVDGDINYAVAKAIDPEINVKHQQLFPYFSGKVNGVNDPTAYPYIAIINTNGILEAIGVPWILESSFVVVQSRRAVCNISNWREEWDAPFKTFMAGLGANYSINFFDN